MTHPSDPFAINKVGANFDNTPGASYSLTSKTPIVNPEQNYLTAGRTASSGAATGFDFAKRLFNGDGTNTITFGSVTSSIHQKGHVGNLNMQGATTRDVVKDDGSVVTEEIKRGAQMYALG